MESLFAKEMEDFLPFSTSGFLCRAFYSHYVWWITKALMRMSRYQASLFQRSVKPMILRETGSVKVILIFAFGLRDGHRQLQRRRPKSCLENQSDSCDVLCILTRSLTGKLKNIHIPFTDQPWFFSFYLPFTRTRCFFLVIRSVIANIFEERSGAGCSRRDQRWPLVKKYRNPHVSMVVNAG